MTTIASALQRAQENLAALTQKLERAERRESRARADSIERADSARRLTGRENLMALQATARSFQSRADDALEPWGLRARAPVLGENLDTYRRDLLVQCKRQLPDSSELRQVQVRALPDSALPQFERMIYDGCKSAAHLPDSVPEGQLRRIEDVDRNGLKIIKWVGNHHFVKDFTIPGRKVRIRDHTEFRNV